MWPTDFYASTAGYQLNTKLMRDVAHAKAGWDRSEADNRQLRFDYNNLLVRYNQQAAQLKSEQAEKVHLEKEISRLKALNTKLQNDVTRSSKELSSKDALIKALRVKEQSLNSICETLRELAKAGRLGDLGKVLLSD